MSKSHRSFCVSFSWTDAGLCIYHMLVWSDFNFLHSSQWISFPTQSFCANDYHYLHLRDKYLVLIFLIFISLFLFEHYIMNITSCMISINYKLLSSSHTDSMVSLTLSLSPSIPIIHCPWQVFQTTSFVRTKLM